ncbi:5-dehydro-4-deoxy-D-glucuronate isomerase [Actinomyces glycerinitolerans]|uniref:4-deoxy-L-threo-5-hexosulose-uronate ketol-isomerase n=1 Tax=Actinomyces glycerinitolerans TaxID=1892869 RepID=A0A1M4S3U6_9ACTO|nr:5-dehydro-4-deoxy-D-glucuronate isomerase [Actinomyces glycerinitolerans]SHE26677.1 kdui/iolb isomerase [Actinomyces glycerinitolerans]
MEQRYATNPEQIPGFDTQDLRDRYLIEQVFVPGQVTAVYTHQDRIVLGGAEPAGHELSLPTFDELRSDFFLQRREMGVLNVGGDGVITVDGTVYEMPSTACLYIGRGARDVVFTDARPDQERGAQFYLFSAPAHADHPTTLALPGDGTVRELGDQKTSNRRTLTQYIHEGGIRSCQVVMGFTRLHEGSMWNTMPAHTHDRRTECYLYFDVPQDARVFHIMGEPERTRHLVVADRQAVISPSWSLHCGVGTAAYTFVWAMAGENQFFDDMDAHPVTEIR